MRRIKWKPELHHYYCTGCRAVKELPAKGSNKVGLAKCKYCRTLVIDSLSAVWTYLATSLTTKIAEGQTPVEGEWTIHSGSNRRDTILWLQGLAENLTSIWERSQLKDTDHLPELTWSTALKSVTLEQVESMRPKPISWPQDLEENQEEETLEELLEEMETDERDVVVEYEGDFEEVVEKVTCGDSKDVTFGNNNNVTSGNVGFGVELNNNSYVKPFNVSEKAKPTTMANNQSKMAAMQAKLAEEMASQQVPQPGQAPVSTPSQGAINRRQADTATGSTSKSPPHLASSVLIGGGLDPLTLSIATRIFFFCAAVKGSKSIWLPLDFRRKRPSSCLSRHSMRPGSGRRLRKSRILRRFHWSISCKFSKCTTFTRCELNPFASPSSSELNHSM